LNTGGLECIDEREQLPLPAYELGAGLTTAAIGMGHRSQRIELLGRRRDVPRPSLTAIRQDCALVKFTVAAPAVRLAALPPQGIERSWEERFSAEAILEQLRKLLLELEQLRAEGTELLAHEWGPRVFCRS
jgi:DNA-binding IclR family transcriptional regulator